MTFDGKEVDSLQFINALGDRGRRSLALVSGVLTGLVMTGTVHAVDSSVTDYSTDIATAVVGLTAGVAASIAAVFLIAALIRVTRIGARAALKALGMIK